MFGLILGIVAAIAIGSLIVYAISLTIKWLKNKISEKLRNKNVKGVAVNDVKELVKEAAKKCDNKTSIKALNDLVDEGYTHMMASVDYDGNIVGDVEVIKDENDAIDKDVEELLNRTNQGMVIVER